ncbi:hypothetical protein OIO90_001130 [Microbotryomycetes sp. JL221]|nr:hypothetical protein OIO90_001130 [Microbotryomycetes sp. JL221]
MTTTTIDRQYVIPGQPITIPNVSPSSIKAGPGTYTRHAALLSSLAGFVSFDTKTNTVSVATGKQDQQTIPQPDSIVIGTVTRITRMNATLSLLTVDGQPCRPDYQGAIRAQDVRQTNKDSVKIWSCFRPGDVVRAKVISLGDSRSYFLSTAHNSLGVLFAVSSTTGTPLEAVSWEEMRDPSTGEIEGRKVAGAE